MEEFIFKVNFPIELEIHVPIKEKTIKIPVDGMYIEHDGKKCMIEGYLVLDDYGGKSSDFKTA